MTISHDDIQTYDYWDQFVIKYTLDSSFYTGSLSYVSNVVDGDEDLFNYASGQWSNVTNILFDLDDLNPEFGFVSGTFSSNDGVALPEYDPGDNDVITRATVVITDSTAFSDEQLKWLAVHEIGHALGLDHPNGGNGNDPDYNQSMTAMSYNPYDYYGDQSLFVFAQTPMYFDVLAIQEKYGVNDSYNYGNDTISVDGDEGMYTIWDGGGTDVIDASGADGASIDLRNDSNVVDGYLEHANYVGNSIFWLAYGAHIENVIGSDEGDYIVGSDPVAADGDYAASSGNNHIVANGGYDWVEGLGGDDTLEGGEEDDNLFGGDGADSLLGDEGSDWLDGGDGNDNLNGGDGSDISLNGGVGSDSIYGGAGSDFVYGGSGADVLSGGTEADLFYFDPTVDSGVGSGYRDIITDFGAYDIFAVDYDCYYIFDNPFTSAGQARSFTANGNTIVQIDIDGNGVEDFEVELVGFTSFGTYNFTTI